MKTTTTLMTVLAGLFFQAAAQIINTTGVPTSCGQNTCCIPACNVEWADNQGCSGNAQLVSNCESAASTADDTDDTGVDICDGSGLFFCGTSAGTGKIMFVINRDGQVAAALFPLVYQECTLSGQCAGCNPGESSCQAPVEIGTVNGDGHNCAALNALYDGSGANLAQC